MKAKINLDSAFDRTILSLCDEIDMLNLGVTYWKKKYENEYYENMKMAEESLAAAKKGVGDALVFAFATHNDEHGNLVISKDNRKELAKNFK